MKRILIAISIIMLLSGCSEFSKSTFKRALVYTKSTNIKTGVITSLGWKEVRILEEKGNMAKIQWINGREITWVTTDNTEFKRLD